MLTIRYLASLTTANGTSGTRASHRGLHDATVGFESNRMRHSLAAPDACALPRGSGKPQRPCLRSRETSARRWVQPTLEQVTRQRTSPSAQPPPAAGERGRVRRHRGVADGVVNLLTTFRWSSGVPTVLVKTKPVSYQIGVSGRDLGVAAVAYTVAYIRRRGTENPRPNTLDLRFVWWRRWDSNPRTS